LRNFDEIYSWASRLREKRKFGGGEGSRRD
ncbi:MAG: hypothetical protein ACI8XO_003130, partial [Verrucomicrobiales bacterium]